MDMDLAVSYICSITLGIIIMFGVIGNVISLIVWSMGNHCSTMSCGYYFRLLAMADIFNLLVSGTVMLLEISPAYFILYDYNILFCKMLPFCAHFGVQLSLWITVSVTIERTLSFRYPLQFYHSKAKKHAYFALILISVFAFILDCMSLWFNDIRTVPAHDSVSVLQYNNISRSTNTSKSVCVLPEQYQTIYRIWNVYISFGCFVVGLPPVFIVCCNILTFITIRRRWNAGINSNNRSEWKAGNHSMNRRSYSVSLSFTYLVVIISIIHCISTIPVGYLYIQHDYFDVKSSPVLYRVALLLFYLNSGTNVLLYCLIGTTFRQDLKQLLKSFCKRRTSDNPVDGVVI